MMNILYPRLWRHCVRHLREGGGRGQDQIQGGGRRQARGRQVDRGRQNQGAQGQVQHSRGKNVDILAIVYISRKCRLCITGSFCSLYFTNQTCRPTLETRKQTEFLLNSHLFS